MAADRIIYCERRPLKGARIVIDGVEYMPGGTALAQELGISLSKMYKAYSRGLPSAGTNFKRIRLYPLMDCKKWLQEHSGKMVEEIVLDGKRYYDRHKIAELLGASPSSIEKWQRKNGLPWIVLNNRHRMYPVDDCQTWYEGYTQTTACYRHMAHLRDRKGEGSICNGCDNAYAHKCCWFRDYTPVDGWTAEKVPFSGAVYSFTFNVKSCPNFKPDPPRNATYW